MLKTLEAGAHRYGLREAREADVPALAALFGEDPVSAARGDGAGGDLADYERGFAAVDADPHQLLVVVTSAPDGTGGIVGTLQLALLPHVLRRGAWRGQLEGVHVAASERGRGLGAALVAWAVDECRARGCALVQLTSSTERTDAHRFYERLGFTASHVGFKRPL